MKLCVFDGRRCITCGALQVNRQQLCGQWKPGLGDVVASSLSAIGITKDRVSKLAGGDCGCNKRQEALNKLGHKLGIGSPTPSGPAAT
jgi:hypothetical protein